MVPIRARFRVQTPLQFAQTVANQSFVRGQPILPLVLPEATGGVSPISYSLTPALPTGLAFNGLDTGNQRHPCGSDRAEGLHLYGNGSNRKLRKPDVYD